MAWVATDDFNSYSAGNLNTLNGGSGWSGAWTQSTGTISVQTARAYEGVNGVSSGASAAALYRRALTSTVTVGTMYISMQSTDTASVFYTILEDGSGNGRMYIKFDSDGNIKIFSNGSGTYITLQSYVIDTWYNIEIDFDNSGHANQYRARVNGGTYSSYYTVNTGTYTSISHVRLERENTSGDAYWDSIGASNLATVSTTSLVSYWKLDESSGNASDSVGSNTLTNTGTATYSSAKINNGVVLNGSSQYLSVADNASLSITGNVTVTCWVNFSSMPADRATIISKPNNAGNGYEAYHVELNKNGANYDLRGLTTVGVTTQTTTYASWNPSTSTWYHIVYTRNSTSGLQALYVNGVKVSQVTNTSGSANDNTDAMYIGKFGSSTDLYFAGSIDEVSLWSRVITDGEIIALYNTGTGLSYPFTASQNLTLTAGTGSFTLTGNATGLSRLKTMTATVGSFILTGIDATLTLIGWTNQTKNSSSWSNENYTGLIDSYATSNQSTNITLYSAQPVVGQTFTTSSDGYKLSYVDFYLRKSGSPTGTAIAQLYAMTDTFGSNGKPTGSVLATSDDFDVSTLTTSYALHSFTFSGENIYSLTGGSYYCIGLRYSGGDVSNQVIVGADSTSSTHDGNGYFSSNGTTYSSSSSDRVFYIYDTTTFNNQTKNLSTWTNQ